MYLYKYISIFYETTLHSYMILLYNRYMKAKTGKFFLCKRHHPRTL